MCRRMTSLPWLNPYFWRTLLLSRCHLTPRAHRNPAALPPPWNPHVNQRAPCSANLESQRRLSHQTKPALFIPLANHNPPLLASASTSPAHTSNGGRTGRGAVAARSCRRPAHRLVSSNRPSQVQPVCAFAFQFRPRPAQARPSNSPVPNGRRCSPASSRDWTRYRPTSSAPLLPPLHATTAR